MTRFDELYAATGRAVTFQTHGELVVYRPKGGSPKPIRAIVIRNPAAAISGVPQVGMPKTIVKVMNDFHNGIDGRLLNTGGDQIDVAERRGGRLETRQISKVQDDFGKVLSLAIE